MPQRGRPPQPGTAEEKAAIRREKVRLYVKAHRERKKNAGKPGEKSVSPPLSDAQVSTSPASSSGSGSTGDIGQAVDPCDCAEFEKDSVLYRRQPSSTTNKVERTNPEESEELGKVADRTVAGWRDRHPHLSPTKIAATATVTTTAKTPFTMTPRGGKEFAYALLGTFRGRLLPDTVRVPSQAQFGSELNTPCSAWITHAYRIVQTQDASALKSCMLACGLALTSLQNQDERLRMASLDVYRKALRQVRNDLKPLTAGTGTSYLLPYMSCLAAAMFEVMHDGYSEKILQHVKGAISLIALIPKDAQVYHQLNDLFIEDLAMWEIVFAIKYRYPSPLRAMRQHKGSRRYMVAGDAKGVSRNATMLGDLLDGADEIPEIMSRVDGHRIEPHSEQKARGLQQEMVKLARVLKDLDDYPVHLHMRFGPVYAGINSSNTFEEGDEDIAAQLDNDLQFVSYEMAVPWIYLLSFHVSAVETSVEAITELLHVRTWQQRQASVRAGSNTSTTSAPISVPLPLATITPSTLPTAITVPHLVGHVQYAPGHENLYRGTSSLDYAPSTATDSEHNWLHKRLAELRKKQRLLAIQLVQACCRFEPIPKGIVGAGLILFPMDRCKMVLKRELRRLKKDLVDLEERGLVGIGHHNGREGDDGGETLRSIHEMSQAMATYETLEQVVIQSGQQPMVEEDD